MKKVTMICVTVLIVGLVFAAAGYALGGVRGLDKVSEKHDWIRSSPGDRVVRGWTVEDFDSVEVTGNADVFLATDDFYTSRSWQDECELLSSTEMDDIGKNKISVICGDKVPEPDVRVEGGVLKIEAKEKKNSGISINFSDVNWTPKILICCPKTALKSVKVDVDTGDVVFCGISYKRAELATDTGDIVMNKVKGEGQKIKSDTGDIVLLGDLSGNTDIKIDTGDVDFKTSVSFTDLTMDLKADTGDITVADGGEVVAELDSVPSSYKHEGGKNKLTVDSDTGDISVSCIDH